ncbi:MAG TPA: TetR family transcriptional regulator [Candidatus Limnocylindrales bacterium]|nr:TetR family transcriptional regulator [Candidatus Limnocylindrales bacterium]
MVIEEPRSARREATRTRVLDAARIVFAEKGVIGATIEDICDQAGFTRGAVYSNFADKDEIVREVMEREHQALLDHITGSIELVEAEVASAGSLEAAVGSLVNRIVRTIPLERQVTLIATELEIMAVRRPDLSGSFLAVNNAFRERLAEFLVAAMARVGREPVVDPLDIIDAVKAIGERSVRRALIEGPDADPDALSEAVLPAVILALSRPIEAPGG